MTLLALVLGLLARATPPAVRRALGLKVADLAFWALPRYRNAICKNLAIVLGLPADHPDVRACAVGGFHTSVRNFVDLAGLRFAPRRYLTHPVGAHDDALPTLLAALARGRGVIAITAHLGAFDTAGQLLSLLPTRPVALTAPTTTRWVFELVTVLRRSRGLDVVPVGPGTIRRVVGLLRCGGLVVLLADRDMDGRGAPATIFGRQTTLPLGPARLARETGAAVVLLLCPRVGDSYRLECHELPMRVTADKAADVAHNVATIAEWLEAAIARWPDQWVMFEPWWPTAPSGRGNGPVQPLPRP